MFLALSNWNPAWERKTKKVCVDDVGIQGFGNLNVQDSPLVLCFLQERIQMWATIAFKVKEFISEVVKQREGYFIGIATAPYLDLLLSLRLI